MSEADKQLAMAYFSAFRDRDETWWDHYIAPGFVRHDPNLDFEVLGPAGVRKLGEMMHGGLSDVDFDIGDVIGEGEGTGATQNAQAAYQPVHGSEADRKLDQH